MNQRVFIIHGWGGSPENDWLPWLKAELTKQKYKVIVPVMPDTEFPKIKAWVNHLAKIVGQPKSTDIFIGHSIGCQTIWRYLEKLPVKTKLAKVILVAPWFTLTNLEDENSRRIAKPWLNQKINFDRVKSKAPNFTVLLSDNDPFVPLAENKKQLEKLLRPKMIVLHNRGHFVAEAGGKNLTEILNLIIF